ncbi:bifunctional diaminohydroxyphosphoribosylaminopyrimidine deaminase/5-amino-6-(5-phosphoribosylamino)uracil reductase RibD [Namhaeicola litoreus]|uniref:Riboflavin biosynthesis protein RibD n=1 Tax=Namhaeicola litoreus TaxID=1052145 RepID=A0ABW3Y2Y2_9FLAO
MSRDEFYMNRCLQLAANGLGTTYPNPLVGSVVVHDDLIIGEGWHRKSGEAHAEVLAIQSVKDQSLLKNATLYVNLEPCSHFGKTPPCADLIIEKGIKKVVVGSLDFNEKVCGRGIEKLKLAGCEVVVGLLEERCKELNKRFFTFHLKRRPFVVLKWAESFDGYLSPDRFDEVDNEKIKHRKPYWISNVYSRSFVHKLRAEEQSILVGVRTAILDNPKLDVRSYAGNNPLRVLIDRDLSLSKDSHIYNGEVNTLVFCDSFFKKNEHLTNIEYVELDFKEPLEEQVLKELYQKGIQSLIIEGGAQTLGGFIQKSLWDEAIMIKGKSIFGKGTEAPKILGDLVLSFNIMDDDVLVLKNKSNYIAK